MSLPGLNLLGLGSSLPIGVPSLLSCPIDTSDLASGVASIALDELALGSILNDLLGGLLGHLNILATDLSTYLVVSLCES